MNNHNLNLFYYILYDASLFLGAFALLVRWGWAHRSIPDQGRFWTGVLATKLMLASFVPMILSFAGLHQPGVYFVITALCLLPARRLAFRLPAGMLAISHSPVWPEPPAADQTRSLPSLWHGDTS